MEISLFDKMRFYAGDGKQVIKTLGLKREFDRNQKLPADKIAQIQKMKFRRLLKHAVNNSEFYREH